MVIETWNPCFSPTAECYGVFAQYRFRCVLGELGRFREGTWFREPVPGSVSGTVSRKPGFRTRGIVPGSEGCEPEVSKVSVFDGFRGVRFCSRGLDGTGSGNQVPGTRVLGTRVPGQGSESYSVLRKYTLVLWKCAFVLWKYTGVPGKYFFVLWKYTYVLRKYTFVLWKYSFVRWKVYFCTLNKYAFVRWKYAFVRWKYAFVLWKCNFVFCHSAWAKKRWSLMSTLQMQTSLLLGIPPTLISTFFFLGKWIKNTMETNTPP